ncbi:hypothetical protein Lal_00033264 [Lupinus albus]|nr:hypothetical protein Lal_00033264 [Lupinus albus]
MVPRNHRPLRPRRALRRHHRRRCVPSHPIRHVSNGDGFGDNVFMTTRERRGNRLHSLLVRIKRESLPWMKDKINRVYAFTDSGRVYPIVPKSAFVVSLQGLVKRTMKIWLLDRGWVLMKTNAHHQKKEEKLLKIKDLKNLKVIDYPMEVIDYHLLLNNFGFEISTELQLFSSLTLFLQMVAFVAVGATMVGSITFTKKKGDHVKKGDEEVEICCVKQFGYLSFGGSIVICVFEKNSIAFDEDLIANSNRSLETLVEVEIVSGIVEVEGITNEAIVKVSCKITFSFLRFYGVFEFIINEL